MKFLWKYIKPYKKYTVVGPIFKLTEAVLELLVPTIMADYLIDIGVKNSDMGYILKIGLIMVVLAALGLMCALVCQYSAAIASQGTGTALRNSIFKHINTLSFKELDKFGTGTLLNRITSDVNTIQQAVAMTIRIAIRAPFICIGSVIMAAFINFKLSLYIFATLPILALIIFLIMRKTIPLYRKVQEKLDKISSLALENLSGVRVIRAFAKKDDERKKFDDTVDEYTSFATFAGKIAAILNPATLCIMNLLIVVILYAGGRQVQMGSLSQGEIIAFTTYITYMLTALFALADYILLFTRAVAGTRRIKELMQTESSITDGAQCQSDKIGENALEFKNVSFAYSDGVNVLENISFTIKENESLGIIGGIGSGKTTLAGLINRFYDVSSGEVLVGGRDVRDYSLEQLRSKVSIVMQNPVLFSGTIASNIKSGAPDCTDEQMKAAADTAQCTEFILSKPDGFESRVEAGGKNLSGGQRQRLAIARALVRRSEILILDDSSSALDFATELKLRRAVKKNSGAENIIIISQRVTAIMDCDKILVLDDGMLAGIGTHKELLETNEVYKNIYTSQTKKEAVV